MKNWSTGAVKSSPTVMGTSGISPTATGARFFASTVTSTSCEAEAPSGSVAVTVTVADPSATAAIVIIEPSVPAVAASVFELWAEKVSASPSGSLK